MIYVMVLMLQHLEPAGAEGAAGVQALQVVPGHCLPGPQGPSRTQGHQIRRHQTRLGVRPL
jgi:hypothetical protein